MTTKATIRIASAIDLRRALDFVGRAISRDGHEDWQTCVQISRGPGKSLITLRGAGFGVQCEATVAADHNGFSAPVMVPYAQFRQAQANACGVVDLRIAGGALAARHDAGSFQIGTVDGDKTKWFTLPESRPFKVDRKELCDALKATVYAVSEEETRYYLCGVRFCNGPEGGAVAVATDGHRMVEYDLLDVFPAGLPFRPFTLPRAAAQVLEVQGRKFKGDRLKIFGPYADTPVPDPDDKDAATIAVQTIDGSRTVLAREIDGTYPNWIRVARDERLEFDTEPMNVKIAPEALAGMRALAKDWGGVKIDSKAQTISLEQVVRGAAEVKAPRCARKIQTIAEAPFVIGFNPAYLEAILNRHGPITLRAVSGSDPSLIIPDKDPRVRIILMPLRV